MTNYTSDLNAKMDEIFWFNLSNDTNWVDYNFWQYKLNQLYRPLVKYFVNEFSSFLESKDANESDQIVTLFLDFFKLYYFQWDFWYFKSKYSSFNYKVPYWMNYTWKDTEFWWASKDCYYVKTSDVVDAINIQVPTENLSTEEIYLKLFKATAQNDNWEYLDFDIKTEPIYDIQYDEYDENNEERKLLWYNIIVYNWSESWWKASNKTILLNQLKELGIQITPNLIDTISDFLTKRWRDYFIHKDLKNFLIWELEWYFFQVLRWDTKSRIDVLTVEKQIEEIKSKYQWDEEYIQYQIWKIYHENNKEFNPSIYQSSYIWIVNFINIISDLEDFKSKLWNKPRKIIQKEYCISVWMIKQCESLIPQKEKILKNIFNNDKQIKERISLWFSKNPEMDDDYLVVDTKNFEWEDKNYLIELAKTNRIMWRLIKSDNYQALKFLENDWTWSINDIYIDPPYNTAASIISYKNNYLHSSWMSMMYDRIWEGYNLLPNNWNICVAIDDFEYITLQNIMETVFWKENNLWTATVRINPKWRMTNKKLSATHEYLLFYWKSQEASICRLPVSPEDKSHNYVQDEDWSRYLAVNLRKQWVDSEAEKNWKISDRYFPIYFDPETWRISSLEKLSVEILPIDSSWYKRIWRRWKDAIDPMYEKWDIRVKQVKWEYQLYYKFRWGLDWEMPKTIRDKNEYSASEYGTKSLDNILWRREVFSYPKSPYAVIDSIKSMNDWKSYTILDFFAWSWTTWQAVMQLNKSDNWNRKFILVELWDYFDYVTLIRNKKIMYSINWKDWKALDNDWLIGTIEYLILNQYEDWFSVNGYLTKLEEDISNLKDLNIDECTNISQILSPLNELKERIYNIDDELSNDQLLAMSRMVND